MEEVVVGGRYRHFKGNLYRVLCVAKHSETQEELVVYEALYGDHQIWARPKGIFLESIEIPFRGQVRRFELVKD